TESEKDDRESMGLKKIEPKRLYISRKKTEKKVRSILTRNPEPKGGFLKPQSIDPEFTKSFLQEAEKDDKELESYQK
ncbi:11787_t:CDS:2, partial [Cetraspora pellucida]